MKLLQRSVWVAVCVLLAALSLRAQDGSSRPPPTPKWRMPSNYVPQYPPAARRAGGTGKVRVEFNIDASGAMQNKVLKGSRQFRKDVDKQTEGLKFDVPSNWTELGGTTIRYAILFSFEVDKDGSGCKKVDASVATEMVIDVCARIRRESLQDVR